MLPIWVLLALAVLAAGMTAQRYRREQWSAPRSLWSATAFVTISVVVTGGYLVGTFSLAAYRGLDSYSVGAANLQDPAADKCLTSDAITTWDATRGVVLPEVQDSSQPASAPVAPFTHDGGWPESDAPPTLSDGVTLWGSYADGGDIVGKMTTPWYQLPERVGDTQRVAVLIGGDLATGDHNNLTLEVRDAAGQVSSGGSGAVRVEDTIDRPGWRTLVIDPASVAPNESVRLVAEDGQTGEDGWFAFTAPVLADGVKLTDLAQPDMPTAVSWTSSFWFPCERPMSITNGIVERPVFATTWASDAPDNIWLENRGGSLAGVGRFAVTNTVASDMAGMGSAWGRVEVFDYPYAADAYDLSIDRVSTWGWRAPFDEVSQLVEVDRFRG